MSAPRFRFVGTQYLNTGSTDCAVFDYKVPAGDMICYPFEIEHLREENIWNAGMLTKVGISDSYMKFKIQFEEVSATTYEEIKKIIKSTHNVLFYPDYSNNSSFYWLCKPSSFNYNAKPKKVSESQTYYSFDIELETTYPINQSGARLLPFDLLDPSVFGTTLAVNKGCVVGGIYTFSPFIMGFIGAFSSGYEDNIP